MSRMDDQILIGGLTAALCALGLWSDRRLLAVSRNGQRLTEWLGEHRALWALRTLLAGGLAFGVLLAAGVVRPVEW